MNTDKFIKENLLVKHVAGSHSYGMNLPESDIDIRGVFYADLINIRTPFFPVREVVDTKEEDTKFYELTHFFKLCAQCNPNIIETLWVKPDFISFSTEAYERIREARSLFLSSKIKFTTSGYAFSQLKRIKGHSRWISNPQPVEPPKISDYFKFIKGMGFYSFLKTEKDFLEFSKNFDSRGKIFEAFKIGGGEHIAFALISTMKNSFIADNQLNFSDDVERLGDSFILVSFDKSAFDSAKENHKQYWHWKVNRNKARSSLEEEFGYDTKHGAHLVRLFRMGMEALETGVVNVWREDADELLEIRAGKWSYEQIIDYAEECDGKLDSLYKNTDLPKYPDLKEIAGLLIDVQDLVWRDDEKF